MKNKSNNVHSNYPYGYLISMEEAYIVKNMPNEFKLFKNKYYLAYDKSLEFSSYRINNVTVVILGKISSISKQFSNARLISEELAKKIDYE